MLLVSGISLHSFPEGMAVFLGSLKVILLCTYLLFIESLS